MTTTAQQVPDISRPDPADVLMLQADALNRGATLEHVYVKQGRTFAVMAVSNWPSPPETTIYEYLGVKERDVSRGDATFAVQFVDLDEVGRVQQDGSTAWFDDDAREDEQ